MRCMRHLVPALLCLMAVYPACAAEHGAHITLLVAQQGLERWEAACAASEGGTPALPLLLDADGRANLPETNLNWAVALMRTGENVELAAQVARAVLVHQDTADGSRTRGLFRWSAAPEAEFAQDATLYLAPALVIFAAFVFIPLVQSIRLSTYLTDPLGRAGAVDGKGPAPPPGSG